MTAIELWNDLPQVSTDPPTEASLLGEAAALGRSFAAVSAHPADILADAEEMAAGVEDLPAFEAGGYPVTAVHFDRITLLAKLLIPNSAQRERNAALRKRYDELARPRRDRLLKVRSRVARQARAAGLPANLFSTGAISTTRLSAVLFRVEQVLDNTEALRERFANQQRVDALVAEGRELIAEVKRDRVALGLMRSDSVKETLLQNQLERLLYDTMRFTGAQGLACFDDDPSRDVRYRLDHIYARRTTRQAAEDEPELPPVSPDDDADA